MSNLNNHLVLAYTSLQFWMDTHEISEASGTICSRMGGGSVIKIGPIFIPLFFHFRIELNREPLNIHSKTENVQYVVSYLLPDHHCFFYILGL